MPAHVLSRRNLLPAAVSVTTTLATAVAGLAVPQPAVAAARVPAVTAHPSSSRTVGQPRISRRPSARFVRGCRNVRQRTRSQLHCARAAMRSFDRARAAEGLGPLILPSRFSTMSPTTQLMVITNIERVDRGLAPARLSRALNRMASYGARHRTDPPLSHHGSSAAANWAGVGRSTLLADYEWVYDDGPGSPNADCSSGGGGCWGHRENVLGSFSRPLRLGAAWSPDRSYGASIATEWVGGDRSDSASGPRWQWVARQIPVGVSPRSVHSRRPGSTRSVKLSACGRGMRLYLYLASGGGSWSLSRSTLRLRAGQSRFVTLAYQPGSGTPRHGVLVVRGPNTERKVKLSA